MIPRELTEADVTRISWLCTASRETAVALCSSVDMADSPATHCARLGLHLAAGIPLPHGYASAILDSAEYSPGYNSYLAPIEGHVLTLAMFAADSDEPRTDLLRFGSSENRELERAVIVRYARNPTLLTEERLRDLSYSKDENDRRLAAHILALRDSRYRVEILARLMDDSSSRVIDAASSAAARTKDPSLADVLSSKGYLRALSFVGDPRAQVQIEALVDSEDPRAGEEAVAMATALGDRTVLVRLWEHTDWDTRSNAILTSVAKGLVNVDEPFFRTRLERETPDHLADLAVRWPETKIDELVKLDHVFCEPRGFLPQKDALAHGDAQTLDRLRSWAKSSPNLCGAAIQFLPEAAAASLASEMLHGPETQTRVVACRVAAARRMRSCHHRLAELCVDAEVIVAEAAGDAVLRGCIASGVYGLDTAVLGCGGYGASISARRQLSRLIEAILLPNGR